MRGGAGTSRSYRTPPFSLRRPVQSQAFRHQRTSPPRNPATDPARASRYQCVPRRDAAGEHSALPLPEILAVDVQVMCLLSTLGYETEKE